MPNFASNEDGIDVFELRQSVSIPNRQKRSDLIGTQLKDDATRNGCSWD